MLALDTNVLVGYPVQDDSGQLAPAKRLIGRCVAEGQSLFVPVTVALELEWVLRASFGYMNHDVLQVLSTLFSARGARRCPAAAGCRSRGRVLLHALEPARSVARTPAAMLGGVPLAGVGQPRR